MLSSPEPPRVAAAALLPLLMIWGAGQAVGAVLDLSNDAGRKNLAGISMDCYMPSYTRLEQLPPCPNMHTAASSVPRANVKLIAVPRKPVFKDFVSVAIEIFRTATEKLQHPPCYELCAFNGTYDELVQNVSKSVFDGAVGDITITDDRARIADFTMPYEPSGVSLLVLSDDDSKPPIKWIFLNPLTTELWLTTVCFFIFTGFVVWVIEWPRNSMYQGSILTQFVTAMYFAFSTLTFSHGQKIRSPLTKVVIVIWCFAVLVLVQSYTANLSSMLTAKRLQPSVTSLNQLIINGDYIGYQEGAFVRSFLRKKGAKEDKLKSFANQTEYAEALRKGSKNGGVSAIVDEIPYLSCFLSDNKNSKEFEMAERLYNTPGLGFVFPTGSSLVHSLSVAILNLTGGNDENSRIQRECLGSAELSKGESNPIADSTPLTLRSFSGLFIITGGVSAFMAIISIIRHRVRRSVSQDRNGGSVPTDQWLHEFRDSNSQGAPGSGRSTEAGPMLDSVPNGSVPQVSIQIEMSNTGQGVGSRDL